MKKFQLEAQSAPFNFLSFSLTWRATPETELNFPSGTNFFSKNVLKLSQITSTHHRLQLSRRNDLWASVVTCRVESGVSRLMMYVFIFFLGHAD
jgi:hypothetical protein